MVAQLSLLYKQKIKNFGSFPENSLIRVAPVHISPDFRKYKLQCRRQLTKMNLGVDKAKNEDIKF